jgi:hypothetical protein
MNLVEHVKAHALAHYEDGGWDVVVECYTDEDIEEVLDDNSARTPSDAIKAFAPMVDVWDDRQQDAINSAF